jgi:hypothetical protein
VDAGPADAGPADSAEAGAGGAPDIALTSFVLGGPNGQTLNVVAGQEPSTIPFTMTTNDLLLFQVTAANVGPVTITGPGDQIMVHSTQSGNSNGGGGGYTSLSIPVGGSLTLYQNSWSYWTIGGQNGGTYRIQVCAFVANDSNHANDCSAWMNLNVAPAQPDIALTSFTLGGPNGQTLDVVVGQEPATIPFTMTTKDILLFQETTKNVGPVTITGPGDQIMVHSTQSGNSNGGGGAYNSLSIPVGGSLTLYQNSWSYWTIGGQNGGLYKVQVCAFVANDSNPANDCSAWMDLNVSP